MGQHKRTVAVVWFLAEETAKAFIAVEWVFHVELLQQLCFDV
jgi:hypothetical protein